ncbi:50S ribosomal protein L4 [candidate division TA06 bacterium]|nr:50S ribosomal protein L4 [candidate division TA06 bacterium]
MIKAPFISIEKESKEEKELPSEIFGLKPNGHVLYEAVRIYLANQRQGTASTKMRGEVRGGGVKPWRQKGTGRARAGSIRSPIWVGGGVVFGPKPRDYRSTLPKKVQRLALKSALSARAQKGEVTVLESLHLEEAKTKKMVEILNRLGLKRGCLLVVKERDETLFRATRNLPHLRLMRARDINTYEVLHAFHVLLTQEALEEVIKRLKIESL